MVRLLPLLDEFFDLADGGRRDGANNEQRRGDFVGGSLRLGNELLNRLDPDRRSLRRPFDEPYEVVAGVAEVGGALAELSGEAAELPATTLARSNDQFFARWRRGGSRLPRRKGTGRDGIDVLGVGAGGLGEQPRC